MADDRARKLAEDAFNRLVAELEEGKSEAFKNYLAAMGRFHRYSWGNVRLIAYQRPTATHVAGIHTWNKLGRIINEGEKGIMILAPIIKNEKELPRTPTKVGEPVLKQEKDNERQPVGFRTAFVYDLAQTHGTPLPQFAQTTGDPKDFADKLRAFVAKEGISLEYDKSIAPAMGVSSGGKIRLVPHMQPAEEFSVLAHELAHEMLHHQKDADRLPKTVVETQAEAVAYVVCRGVGLETNSAAADYIQLYNGEKKTLAESLSVIHETSSKILDQLLPERRESPFHEKSGRAYGDGPSQSHGEPERGSPAGLSTTSQAPDHSDSISLDR
jgi:N-terminal domain of anti-restriction factor ArdC/IrrE N-terminal-like domain